MALLGGETVDSMVKGPSFRFRGVVLAVYMGCIYLSLGNIRVVSSWLRSAGVLGWVTAALIAFSVIMLVWLGARCCENQKILFGLAAMVVLVACLVSFPEERIHLIEYGVAGWLSAWALSARNYGFLPALLLVYMLGLCDEMIQYLLPGRVYDDRDVVLNFFSGLAGVLIFSLCSSRAGS